MLYYVTLDFSTNYDQVIESCIIEDKGWERAGHAPRQVVTLQGPEDEVKLQVEPNCGAGWKVSVEGQSKVGRQQYKHVLVV